MVCVTFCLLIDSFNQISDAYAVVTTANSQWILYTCFLSIDFANRNGMVYILSVYSPFSDRVGLPLHNIHIPSPFTSIMDIFFVNLKFCQICFYTL